VVVVVTTAAGALVASAAPCAAMVSFALIAVAAIASSFLVDPAELPKK
jgi:hypothetical protein